MILALFIFTIIAVFGAGWKLSEISCLIILGERPWEETTHTAYVWTGIAILGVLAMMFVLILHLHDFTHTGV